MIKYSQWGQGKWRPEGTLVTPVISTIETWTEVGKGIQINIIEVQGKYDRKGQVAEIGIAEVQVVIPSSSSSTLPSGSEFQASQVGDDERVQRCRRGGDFGAS